MNKQFEVSFNDTAKNQGSGDLVVLSTPRLIAYMENVAKSMIPDVSVGYKMNITHLAPTPVGALITINCELINTENNRYEFIITASDCIETIAKAEHTRVVIDKTKFQNRVDKKMLPQ